MVQQACLQHSFWGLYIMFDWSSHAQQPTYNYQGLNLLWEIDSSRTLELLMRQWYGNSFYFRQLCNDYLLLLHQCLLDFVFHSLTVSLLLSKYNGMQIEKLVLCLHIYLRVRCLLCAHFNISLHHQSGQSHPLGLNDSGESLRYQTGDWKKHILE